MTEWELDHVLLGLSDKEPSINEEEVAEFKYMPLDEIDENLNKNPQNYTEWFKICFERVKLAKEIKKLFFAVFLAFFIILHHKSLLFR